MVFQCTSFFKTLRISHAQRIENAPMQELAKWHSCDLLNNLAEEKVVCVGVLVTLARLEREWGVFNDGKQLSRRMVSLHLLWSCTGVVLQARRMA